MRSMRFQTLDGHSAGYRLLVAVLGILVVVGPQAAHHMDVNGHYVTGMNNQVVWGMPHVFSPCF